MGVIEFFVGLFMVGVVVILLNLEKWLSNGRMLPPGKTTDWNKATTDILTKGESYYHKQHLAGKYDIDIEEDKKK